MDEVSYTFDNLEELISWLKLYEKSFAFDKPYKLTAEIFEDSIESIRIGD